MGLARTEAQALAAVAARLHRGAVRLHPRPRVLPPLLFLTDPERTPDMEAAIAALPAGTGVVVRSFGRPELASRGVAAARALGLRVLVGADPRLAQTLSADGVHLPERLLHLGPRLRRAHPRWLLTGAAHSAAALRRARAARLDAVLLSPVFPSGSASAAGVAPLGPVRFAALARGAGVPVYGLGGITAASARRLRDAVGLAAVEALANPGGD